MNPSKPSEWIGKEARRLRNYLPRAEVGTHESMLSWGACQNQATFNFLDLLHSQGKLQMPDNVQPPKSAEVIEGMKLIKAVFNPEKQ